MSNTVRTILIVIAVLIIGGLLLAWILGAFDGGDDGNGEEGSGGSGSVSGEVVYQVRSALPEGAVLTVSITNASLADAATQPLGFQIYNNPGQVPIPYEVKYSPDDVDERLMYSIGARIEDGQGNLLFISDTVTPVITNGNPTENVTINVIPVG